MLHNANMEIKTYFVEDDKGLFVIDDGARGLEFINFFKTKPEVEEVSSLRARVIPFVLVSPQVSLSLALSHALSLSLAISPSPLPYLPDAHAD